MTTLTHAFNQWATRPADERFNSLQDLKEAVQRGRKQAVEARSIPVRSLRVIAENGSKRNSEIRPQLVGNHGEVAEFTHWSFGQLCRRVGAPADYIRGLPPVLAAENLNHGLQTRETLRDDDNEEAKAKLLFSRNGSLQLRALTGDGYTRIWNADIVQRLERLVQQQPEWQPAPPAFDGSRGLYASDEDMFAFMVDNDRRIFEKDKNGGLGRGFFVSNSEVGAASFWIMTFLYEYCCGNHRVWGAQGVQELRIRHVGRADDKAFAQMRVELRKFADASAATEELKVKAARKFSLGADKDEVLDKVFGLRIAPLSRRIIGQAYDLAEQREDWYGNPRSAWGLTGGLTEIARDMPNASERTAVDRAAGKILQIAF